MTQAQLVQAINAPTAVNELLAELHKIAISNNSYEYGLPIFDKSIMAEMREVVYRWLLKQKKEGLAGDAEYGLVQRHLIVLRALQGAAEEAYRHELVDTEMVNLCIGPELEYADKSDWLASKQADWLEKAENAMTREQL